MYKNPSTILEGIRRSNFGKAMKYLSRILTDSEKEVFLKILREGGTGMDKERKAFYEHLDKTQMFKFGYK